MMMGNHSICIEQTYHDVENENQVKLRLQLEGNVLHYA